MSRHQTFHPNPTTRGLKECYDCHQMVSDITNHHLTCANSKRSKSLITDQTHGISTATTAATTSTTAATTAATFCLMSQVLWEVSD